MTVLARRFAIIFLTSCLFAAALMLAVESGSRRGQIMGFEPGAPCLQAQGLSCRRLF